MTSLRPQCDLEIGSRNLKNVSCNLTLLLQKLKVASKPSEKVSSCPRRLKKQPRDTKKVKKSVKLKKAFYGIFYIEMWLTLRYQRNEKNENHKIQQYMHY